MNDAAIVNRCEKVEIYNKAKANLHGLCRFQKKSAQNQIGSNFSYTIDQMIFDTMGVSALDGYYRNSCFVDLKSF